MVLSGQAGLLILEKQEEKQEIKDIIANREEGFGYQLKVARNEKNLTTTDVARELKLDEKIIIALESEDQSSLPVSAFVCGYIRNYARFLNIQPEPLVEYYKHEYRSNCSDPELKITRGKGIQGHTERPAFIMPVLGIAVAALLLFGGWQLWQYVSSEYLNKDLDKDKDSLISIVAESSDNSAIDEDPSQLSLPEPDRGSLPPLSESTADTLVLDINTSESVTSGTVNNIAVEKEAELQKKTVEELNKGAGNEAISLPLADKEDNEVTDSEISAEPQPEQAQSEAVPVSQDLNLQFNGDSWVVIKDATGKKLATGLKRAGQTLSLKGQPPYNLFLGNGRVVDVSIHGKKYDHSRYINNKNIARFSVE